MSLLTRPTLTKPSPQAARLQAARAPGPSIPTAKTMGAEAIQPRALLGGAVFGLGGESAGEEVGTHVEKELAGAQPGPLRREAARLGGAAVSGALTPLPGVGTAARAGYNVLGTAGADIAREFTDNPIAQFLAGTGLVALSGHMLDRAYATEPFERAQGAPPKVGAEASLEAREPEAPAPPATIEPAEADAVPAEPQATARPRERADRPNGRTPCPQNRRPPRAISSPRRK